ncbi:MAG: toxin, partial [Isosphaeraceae bacterium]
MGATNFAAMNYHVLHDHATVQSVMNPSILESEFLYTFENFFHPRVDQLIEQLNRKSIPGLLDPGFLSHRDANWFGECYTAETSGAVAPGGPHVKVSLGEPPVKEIDLSAGGSYASYNWELLFHIPFTIAVHLSKNQRFAEAQRWFHFIFDPTAPPDYWKFLQFRQESAGKQIDKLLALLSKPDAECTATERAEKKNTLDGYLKILERPFQPHAVARTRPLAYRYAVVMRYLDNLIAWGDHLFRQDTLESVNEATQLYVLAANILGKRPEKIPLMGKVRPKTFAQLKKKGLDEMGNALVEMEGQFPFNLGTPTASEDTGAAAALFGIGRTLYFCIPQNDTLLRYWDTVADRLFKIRHCLNIEGILRPLALFDPPLDPGMLVKAAAAGIDIGAVVAGLNQPVSPVRAQILIHKALELCAEVRSLGASLLQAIEKGDSERLAVLRQGHEIKISQLQQDVRFLQWKQAQAATESLLKSRAIVLERYTHYLHLLGQAPDTKLAPEAIALDRP